MRMHTRSLCAWMLAAISAWLLAACFTTESTQPLDVQPQSQQLGAGCEWNVECTTDLCIPEVVYASATGWPGGVCTQSCSEASCPEGGVCVRLADGGYCMASCAPEQGDCRDGYVCHTGLLACLPDCRQGWDCGDGFRCGHNGQCQLDAQDLSVVGAPCEHDYDCASGICAAATDGDGSTGWTDGMCLALCGSTHCGTETGCVVLGEQSWCLPACGTDKQPCREGYVCSGDAAVCLPDCRLGWDCGSAMSCGPETGECEFILPEPPPAGTLGAPCTDNLACNSQLCLLQTESSWTSGICTRTCADDCPLGRSCAQLDGQSYCLPLCEFTEQCPPNYVCDLAQGACVPDCRQGWECTGSDTCRISGLCDSGGGPGPGPG